MSLLITGALGHIGSRLIRDAAFLNKNKNIILVDNFLTQRYSSLLNLESGAFIFHELDVRDSKMEEIVQKVSKVLHLAAITNATETIGNRNKVLANNMESTKYITELCYKYNKELLFISSTSVYGKSKDEVNEKTQNLEPQTPYAESKLLEEQIVEEYILKGLKATIFRFGTIYGTSIGMRFHTAVNKFCFDAVLGKNIKIWEKSYNQKRPYLYLGDAVTAINLLFEDKIEKRQLYNVITENLTVESVIENIRKFIPNLKIEFVDDIIINQHSYEVNFEKIMKGGFSPLGNISDGVQEILFNLKGINNNNLKS